MTWSNPRETILEATLSRGDRRLSNVIEDAWRHGAKFDAWMDQFNYNLWIDALEGAGLPPAIYTSREREISEVLPWDHISTGISRKYLEREYQKALNGETTEDCRDQCLGCGIVPAFQDIRKENDGIKWYCPEVE